MKNQDCKDFTFEKCIMKEAYLGTATLGNNLAVFYGVERSRTQLISSTSPDYARETQCTPRDVVMCSQSSGHLRQHGHPRAGAAGAEPLRGAHARNTCQGAITNHRVCCAVMSAGPAAVCPGCQRMLPFLAVPGPIVMC